LIKGFSLPYKDVRDKVFNFLNHESRISLKPVLRLNHLMKDLYSPMYEDLWLNSAVPLLLSISKKSGDYERKLFDTPLTDKFAFYDYDISFN